MKTHCVTHRGIMPWICACALVVLMLTACDKADSEIPVPLTRCELAEKYLYEGRWMWMAQPDTNTYLELTVFHHDQIERLIVFERDTVSREFVDYAWLDECFRFCKADSDAGVEYRIAAVGSRHMVLSQYRDNRFCKDIYFVRK